jgi:hypothetical protein
VTSHGAWSRVFVDRDQCLVYSPNFGRLYMVTPRQALERPLQRILGLRGLALQDGLADPAQRIVHDLSNLKSMPSIKAPRPLRIAYQFLGVSRALVPLGMIIPIVKLAAAISRKSQTASSLTLRPTASDIGRMVHSVERAIGLADCYPRALLTCFLCLKNRYRCDLVVGTLAPTRKMHAWCSTEGLLPYEALPEHYMYRPLLVITLSP